ncbi:MAG: pyridoxine 5'-phosphate synthase [Deltaproteobacteria bacterium]|nr:pyridoxine 5'-phosphate synthase [Deltaproteobacteria bacterium]MCK5709949.1 pyridoxine 5'-phosphate synthase [Deltaproteobacteria bacterium]
MPKLNVNVDHVATIRQARGTNEPDPVLAAFIAELAGAHGIVVHLREDRRHIQDRDLLILRQTVKTKLNMEMAATNEMVRIASQVKPDMVTLVPEKREELTTEGGLDVVGNLKTVSKAVKKLRDNGVFVSLFIDPDKNQIKASKEIGADMVELHTGLYADSNNEKRRDKELIKIEESVGIALDHELRVAAGHGLDYTNVEPIAWIEEIEELNIGHSIISRSVIVGIEQAVSEMLVLCE